MKNQNEITTMIVRFFGNTDVKACGTTARSSDDAGDLTHADPIDAEALLACCADNLEFAGSLLDALQASGMAHVVEIQQRAAELNPAEAAEAVHALQGAAGTVCAMSVQKLAAEIEQAGRSDAVEDIETKLVDLVAEMQRTLDYIPKLRKQLDSVKEGV